MTDLVDLSLLSGKGSCLLSVALAESEGTSCLQPETAVPQLAAVHMRTYTYMRSIA